MVVESAEPAVPPMPITSCNSTMEQTGLELMGQQKWGQRRPTLLVAASAIHRMGTTWGRYLNVPLLCVFAVRSAAKAKTARQ